MAAGEVRRAFHDLTDPDWALAEAAAARQRIDLAWGAVLTRFLTLECGSGRQVLSAGRVQTPTLRLVADRERDRESFVPRPFWNVTLVAGETQSGLDFGVKQASLTFPAGPQPIITGTLSGLAFIDLNGNGRRDRTDKILKCTLFFDLDRDGVLDSNEPRIKLTTGSYNVTHIPTGTWKLGVILPRGLKLVPRLKPITMSLSKLRLKLNLIARPK